MDQDITFIPLGGGQRVGASCYYLRIGGKNLLLDTGISMSGGLESGPGFRFLITSPFLQSMGQIDQIFISHAHMDHVGYLPKLMEQAKYAGVYMTGITKVLSEYQLYDRACNAGGTDNAVRTGSTSRDGCASFGGGTYGGGAAARISREAAEEKRLALRSLFDRVAVIPYMQTTDFGGYRVTFYQAGHIPGAAMMLFEAGGRKILYTGDYSTDSTPLTNGCLLPDKMDIDTMILCGLHAKHPDYVKKTDSLYKQVRYALRFVQLSNQPLLCRVSQLSKGMEFLAELNRCNNTGIPIYLDEGIMQMVEKMEKLSIPVLAPCNHSMGLRKPAEPHIFLTSQTDRQGQYADSINVDFSLHEDFAEMKAFIKKVNPKQAVLVHCGKENSMWDPTIEQYVMRDGQCRTQFIFAEESEIYCL